MKNYNKSNNQIPKEREYYSDNVNFLENEVEKLSQKYKMLLERTRNQDEDYSQLRSELKQTAFDLEVQSFNLYQSRKEKNL